MTKYFEVRANLIMLLFFGQPCIYYTYIVNYLNTVTPFRPDTQVHKKITIYIYNIRIFTIVYIMMKKKIYACVDDNMNNDVFQFFYSQVYLF